MKVNVDQNLRKAQAAARQGNVAEAERLYREILAVFPANKRASDGLQALLAPAPGGAYEQGLQVALALYDQGRLQEMLDHVRPMMAAYPSQADLYNLAGVACSGMGLSAEALEIYDRAIRLNPRDCDLHINRAIALEQLGRAEEALASCDTALALQPGSAASYLIRGMALRRLRRVDEALVSYEKAIGLQPNWPEAHYNRGNLLLDIERFEEAVASYDAALRFRPTYPVALTNRGNALRRLKRTLEALRCYDEALALQPGSAEAHSNRGAVLQELGRSVEALSSCAEAVRLQPASAEIRYNLGSVLQDLQRLDDAVSCYDEAIRLAPDHAQAHANRGGALRALAKFDEALASYDAALALSPEDVAARYGRALALDDLRRIDEAIDAYRQVLALDPDHAAARAQLLFQQAFVCDWSDEEAAGDLAWLGIDTDAVSPFTLLALEDEPLRQLARARKWVAEKYRAPVLPLGAMAPSPVIRVGYFSADFHNHATMHLMAKLLESHDRSRFEIHAFSYGSTRDSFSERAARAVDRFHEVAGLSDMEIAALARQQRIDIAVDLKGFTHEMRLGIFSHRAAPVQIAFLGYPGSSGAPFIDYIVADDVVIPERSHHLYSEKVISLPGSYQVNDDGREIAARHFDRAELGLPERGFVFCSFNANYKIRPAEFDIWMRLLDRVEGSVLWLLADNIWAKANLRAEAVARGIDPDRLVFAERMPAADHLARHRCADLFLDSFNCNAHTTASDALWAGLPIITRAGESFASRVAASLLTAVDLPDLIVDSADDYEALAFALATDPVRLAALRGRLERARDTSLLFDSRAFARHLESAYAIAHRRHLDGKGPAPFKVPPIDTEEKRQAA